MTKTKTPAEGTGQSALVKSKELKKKMKHVQNRSIEASVTETSGKQSKSNGDKKLKKFRAKKRKEKKQEKLKKSQKSDLETTETTEESADQLAIKYLHQWKNDRDNWGFKKIRQLWLLKHIYDETVMSSDDFNILLEYLEGLKGNGRDMTLAEAQAVLNEYEKNTSDDPAAKEKYNRARQVMQSL